MNEYLVEENEYLRDKVKDLERDLRRWQKNIIQSHINLQGECKRLREALLYIAIDSSDGVAHDIASQALEGEVN